MEEAELAVRFFCPNILQQENKMKKILTALLTLAILLSMSACGAGETSPDQENSPPASSNFLDDSDPTNSSVNPIEPGDTAVDLGQYCQEDVDGWYKTDTLENDEWSYWIRYSKSGKTDHCIIVQYLGTDTSIVVPETIDGYPVTQFRAFGGVELTKNIDAATVTSIALPDTVYFITAGLLDNTAWFKNQPDGPVYLGKILYAYKGKLSDGASFTVADGTIGIAGKAFENQKGVAELTMPDTVICIGNKAFKNCSNLYTLNLSKELRQLGGWAFDGSSILSELHISSKFYYFDQYAFENSKIWNVYYEGSQEEWNELYKRCRLNDELNLHFDQTMPE